MKVLMTGGSSFTGIWFARNLAASGHTVMAPLRRPMSGYTGLRAQRVAALRSYAEVVEDCPFGSARFLDVAESGDFDLLCHHAARVENYRSPDFDVVGALAENTFNLKAVLTGLLARGLRGVVLTGSIFEDGEGAGSVPLRAFSPYGLSKTLTWHCFRFFAETMGFGLGKFVIPNPFGPLEEPRFCGFLVRSWLNREVPAVRTPYYVRDNIHVDLLACAYAAFAAQLPNRSGIVKLNPSGYVETMAVFTRRFAGEMERRLGVACPVAADAQTEFTEPMVRINTDRVDGAVFGWNEAAAWDAAAAYFQEQARS